MMKHPIDPNDDKRESNGQQSKLAVKIEDLKLVNRELTDARRAALNLLEDAVLSREALRESEEKYRGLFETIDEGFALYELIRDRNGNVVDMLYRQVNHSYERLTGLQNVVGHNISELVPNLEPSWFEKNRRVADTGIAERAEDYIRDLGRWFSVHFSRLGGAGSNLIIAVFDDITERKHEEQRKDFFLKLNDVLRPMVDPASILSEAMRLLRSHLGSTLVAYSVVSEDEEFVTPVAEDRDAKFISMLGVQFRWTDLEPEGATRFRWAQSIHRNDIKNDPGLPAKQKAAFAAIAIGSYAVVPLVKEGKLVACLAAYNTGAHAWTADETRLLDEVGERTWVALEKAKAEDALRKSKQILARELQDAKQLQAFSNQLIHLDDEHNIYETLLETAMSLMQSDLASIQLYSTKTETLSLIAHKNFHPRSAQFWQTVSATSGSVCGEALRQKSRILVSDIEGEDFAKGELEIFRLSGIRAVQSTPIISRNGDFIGMLNTQWKQPRKFTNENFHLFDVLVRQAADLIERKHAEDALRKSEELVAEELADTKILHLLSKTVIDENKVIEESKVIEENKIIEEKTVTIYRQILEAAIEIMQSDMGSIQMFDPEKEELILKWHVNFHPESAEFFKTVKASSATTCGLALINGERAIITDVDNSEFMKGTQDLYYSQLSGIKAVQSTPLKSRSGKILGMFSNHWKRVHQPSEQKLRLLDVLARQAADVIDRKLAEDSLLRNRLQLSQASDVIQQALHDTQLLRDLGARLLTETNIDAFYHDIVDVAIKLTNADAGTIQLYDKATKQLRLITSIGIDKEVTDHFQVVEASSNTSCGKALTRNERVLIDFDDPEADDPDGSLQIHVQAGIISAQSTPLTSRSDQPIGMLNTHFRKRNRPTEHQLRFIDLLARQAADLIEQRQAEEALQQREEQLRLLNARLQETDKAKTAFFSNVSHEFRTPLTLLIGPLEELIKSGKSKLHADDMLKLQFAHRSATRLQKLVTTLLDFSRIEAGKLEAYYQPVDFSKTTIELVSNFRSAIEKAGLKFVVKAEQIAEPIYLNRDMWEKIVFNLLSNAFKFTHKGKIEVIIREKKKNAELKIKDTGVGIAPKDIDRIFDRFTRIEGIHARTIEGTGIGLALVRELVTAHGGVIKVRSVLGEGSEFIVSIPKGKAHFAKHQIFENRERQVAQDLTDSFNEEILGWLPEDVKTSRKNLKRYQKEGASRILIVEDNADMRDYLSTVLLEDDHKIFALENGQKVVTFLEEGGQADLILADVMMPVLDGFEMTKKLKANTTSANIPVILLTAKTAEDAKIEGLRIGAEAYLTKPFSAKELRAIVQSVLARSRKHRDSV